MPHGTSVIPSGVTECAESAALSEYARVLEIYSRLVLDGIPQSLYNVNALDHEAPEPLQYG